MRPEQSHGPLLDINEAATYLNVSKWTLRRLVNAGALPVVRLPVRTRNVRRLLFDKSDLVTLVAQSKEVEPDRPDGG